MSEKEEILNEVLEVGNWYLDESNEKLRNALQNKDLTAMSVAQAMIEKAHKKIKRANTDMVLNPKKKKRTVEEKEQSIIDMLRERPVAKKIKSGDSNRLVDVKGRDS